MRHAGIDTKTRLNENLQEAFAQAFARTEAIFQLVEPKAYTERPIALRHPINFYEGHLPAFLWNTLFRRVLKQPAFNPAFDQLFERGIDPGTLQAAQEATLTHWPTREAVQKYRATVHKYLFEWLHQAELESDSPVAQLLFLILEHELMHQETLLYMLHQLPYALKKQPAGWPLRAALEPPQAPSHLMVEIPAGQAQLGAEDQDFDFTWDNEQPSLKVQVPAFAMDACKITNGDFLNFMEDGGYQKENLWSPAAWQWVQQRQQNHPQFWKRAGSNWLWHGFFEEHPLPLRWPVYVTQAEAAAYAQWKGSSLPTEAEWHRAAFGDEPQSGYPWGSAAPTLKHGNFGFANGSPVSVGSYPQGASPQGIHDLMGNGWEWTDTPFAPLPGFKPSAAYPQYSADFFDGQHVVIKGASCFTDVRLLRRSFRNWYYWHYPYAYIGFRCVKREK
jgi:iron(II)-dependent oxidoreductase